MFGILGALILYTLFTLGATRPYWQWGLVLLWITVFTLIFLYRLIRRRDFSVNIFALLLLGFDIFFLFPYPKLMAGVFAISWGWMAAQSGQRAIQRFFNFLVVVGVLEALLALVQYFVLPGWIFGYINTWSIASGTLINKNHFAGLMELLIPIAFARAYVAMQQDEEQGRSHIYLLGGAIMGLALAFSFSRSGIFSFACTVLFMGVLFRLSGLQRRMRASLILGLLGLVLAGVIWIGSDVVVHQFSSVLSVDAVVEEGRPIIYRDAVRLIRDHPMGVGAGRFQDAFRKYQEIQPEYTYDHTHNDYLETTAEWGMPVALAFWIFVFSVLALSVRAFVQRSSPEHQGILLGCVGAVFSILMHSLTDFNLQIPSNALLFFIFVGILIASNSRKVLI